MNLQKRRTGGKILLGALAAFAFGLGTEQLIVGGSGQPQEPVQTQQTQKEEPNQDQVQKEEPVQVQDIQKVEPNAESPKQESPKKEPGHVQTQKERLSKIPADRQGKLGPQCKVGDSWTVETSTVQFTSAVESAEKRVKVQWQFKVESIEQVADRDCFRILAECIAANRNQPEVIIWVDCASGMLARVTSRVPVRGSWAEFTETYLSNDGAAVPVIGVIPVLPLDMPIFESDENSGDVSFKSLEPKSYDICSGDIHEKGLDTVGFTREVSQTVTRPDTIMMKSIDETLPQDTTVQVEIGSGQQSVKQVWAPGNPWPVYSDNGVTESRLLDFVPAQAAQE